MALNLVHLNPQTLNKKLREAIRFSEKETTVKLYNFVLNRTALGDIIEADLRAEFGMNAGQWNSFKARMQAAVQSHRSIENLVGE